MSYSARRACVSALAVVPGVLLLLVPPAHAHDAVLGITGYPVLVLHPFIVLDHAFCLVAAGLFAGQQQSLGLLRIFLSLMIGTIAGFAALVLLPGFPGDVFLPLIGAILIGVLAAVAPQLNRWAGSGVIVAAGFAVGLNTYPVDALPFILAMTLGGLMIGVTILVIGLAWIVSRLTRKWQRIGVRIAASWVAASTLLVFALAFAG